MAKIVLLAFLTMFLYKPVTAQDKSEYEKYVYVSSVGDTLLYRLLIPKDYDAEKEYPLIVYLHGSGERGNDNEFQLHHGWEVFLADSVRSKYPAFVLFPQCPLESRWYGRDSLPTQTLFLTNEVVDGLVEEKGIDTDRLYIMGLSMGGHGTFGSLETWPDKYAAAMPICGWANTEKAKDYAKKTAIWIFHGSEDKAVDPERSRQMYAALQEEGCDVRYTEYEGVGHNSWAPAFAEPEFFVWLFSKSK